MSVRLSTDGCRTWSAPWSLWTLASGYSDLVQCENSSKNTGENAAAVETGPRFGIVFEGGYIDTTSSITFQTFTLKDVLDGVRASNLELETNRIVS